MTISYSAAFPNGVSSGDVTQDSAVLWTRAIHTGRLRIQISTTADFSDIVKSKSISVVDTAAPVKLEFDHLQSGTQYFYRVVDADGDTLAGSFRTAEDLGNHSGFHFGVGGDYTGELAPYVALKNAASAGLDLFVKLGDTVYADAFMQNGVLIQDPATTPAEFQLKYETVYGSNLGHNYLAELQATTPILSMIDDAEVLDNFAGGAPPSSDPRFAGQTGDFINETPLYQTGLAAFDHFNAIETRVYSGTGNDLFDGAPDLYRYNTYGSDAAMIMVDQRTFRDPELAGGVRPNPAPFLAAAFDLNRSMLGDVQLARLEQDLLDARDNDITWKFVMLSEPIQNYGPFAFPEDRYEGYAAERTEILKFIEDNHVENVVFVSSDSHWLSVNNLTYQEVPFGPQIASSAIEVTTMSVGSSPLGPSVPPVIAGFPEPFGITPAQLAFYNALPNAPDSDSIPNDKDDFVKLIMDKLTGLFGYDSIGLDGTQATLLQGDYLVAHSLGWTDFNIDGGTGQLLVTTYGVPAYTDVDVGTNPDEVLALDPAVVSQFALTPTSDSIIGTSDSDHLTGTADADVILGAAGNDMLTGLSGNDYLDGGKDNDRIYGGDGNDRIFGRDGNDRQWGGAGDDQIDGGQRDDRLNGGAGNDILEGGLGNDRLRGGLGSDTFLFATDLGNRNADQIVDYSVADDTIALENAVFQAFTSTGALAAGSFRVGAAAADANDLIVYNRVTGALYYDADGSGGGAKIKIATLDEGLMLTSNDFLIT